MLGTPIVQATDVDTVTSIAAGSTLGLEQALKANAGQVALTALVVGITTNGKLQGTSLGDGNVVEVYADGDSFNSGTVLYREFMALGEPIVLTGLSAGAIVTATKGFYAHTEITGDSTAVARQATMPMMSYGLSFQRSFVFAFRNSTGNTNDRGVVFIANGPLANRVSILTGAGVDVLTGQKEISLNPWESILFDTDGNQEYIVEGLDAPIMAQSMARAGGAQGGGFTNLTNGRQWDARLITPLTVDGILNPRSGNASALFDGTIVNWYAFNGATGTLNAGAGFGPGSPVDIDAATPTGTGLSLTFHNPAGYVRMRSNAPFTAYSGADASGGDAANIIDVNTMSQRVAQPLYIRDDGSDASETGITIFSPYEGTAKVYAWNSATSQAELAYTVPLTRGVTATTREQQFAPAAGCVSNSGSNTNNITLVGNLMPGYIEADVPIGVIVQSIADTANTDQVTLRSQNGTTALSILSVEDETVCYGWTPPEIAAEIRADADGLLRKRVIDNAGAETWVVA